jgi:DNA primase
MLISPDSIQKVKEATNIVDVINDYVVLKRAGQSQVGLCPFHDDKSPSFFVTEDKQLYHCFGCDAGGDVVDFLTRLNNQSFSEVILDLARRSNIEVEFTGNSNTEEFQQQKQLDENLKEVLAIASEYYQSQLSGSAGEKVREYLGTQRKLTQETINKFQLGYAPSGWNNLYEYLVADKKYSPDICVQAGLIIEKEDGGYYDRFRDRLMIPICDALGKVIAFGGRSLDGSNPKYLHSPETRLFEKSKVLFGLNHAVKGIGQEDCAIVVEGYFDAIALHQSGITNVVACQGTALTKNQINKLIKYTKSRQLILFFDGDAPGVEASRRTIDSVFDLINIEQIHLKVLSLPNNLDPADWVSRYTVESLKEKITTAPHWVEWLLNNIFKDKDLSNPVVGAKVHQDVAVLLARIESQSLQAHYLAYCAEILGAGNSGLNAHYLAELSKSINAPIKKQVTSTEVAKSQTINNTEFTLLKIYLHNENDRDEINNLLYTSQVVFLEDISRRLWNSMRQIEKTSSLTIDSYRTYLSNTNLLPENESRALFSGEIQNYSINLLINGIKRKAIQTQIDYYKNLWLNATDKDLQTHYQSIWQELFLINQTT